MSGSIGRQKPIYLLKRLPTVTHQDFAEHWFHVHGGLLKTIPEFHALRSGYVQNHLIAGDPGDLSPFPYDGVTQVYVRPDAVAQTAFPDLPVFRDRVIPDEETFLDRQASLVLKTVEHILIPGSSALKVYLFHRRRAGLSHTDVTTRWAEHGCTLASDARVAASLSGFRQNLVDVAQSKTLSGQTVPDNEGYDAVSEFWFASISEARTAFALPAFVGLRSQEREFFEPSLEIGACFDPRIIIPD